MLREEKIRVHPWNLSRRKVAEGGSVVNDSSCAETLRPCIILHLRRQTTRFARRRFNSFGSCADSPSLHRLTKMHLIARSMTSPTPLTIYLNRW